MNLKIKDLLNNNGKLMSPKDLKEKKKWKINTLHINSLLSAIPRSWIAEIEKSNFIYNDFSQYYSYYQKFSKTDSKGKQSRSLMGKIK